LDNSRIVNVINGRFKFFWIAVTSHKNARKGIQTRVFFEALILPSLSHKPLKPLPRRLQIQQILGGCSRAQSYPQAGVAIDKRENEPYEVNDKDIALV